MSTPFKRLMDTIRPHLPGAIDDAIRQELYMVCLDFFKRSNVWREDIEFTLRTGKRTAYIMPMAGKIERLLHVTKDGYPIRGAYLQGPEEIQLPFESSSDTKYVATVVLRVADPVSRDAYPIVPYEIVERYTEELMHGILARMLSQQSKPYTNLSLAQFHLQQFRGGISRARMGRDTGDTMNSSNWVFPRSF